MWNTNINNATLFFAGIEKAFAYYTERSNAKRGTREVATMAVLATAQKCMVIIALTF
jgi:hypothetical protein